MGKFLGSALKIIGGAFLVAFAFPLVAAGGIAAAVGAGITAAGAGTLFSGASEIVSGVLGLGPSSQKPDTAETAIKTPRPPRVSAYGASRLYGAYILFETADDGTAVDVFAVHDGKVDGIIQHYLADDRVMVTGGVVQEGDDGRYADGKARLFTTDGSTPGVPISAVTAKLPAIWSPDHRGDGVVLIAGLYASVKAEKFLDVYPNGAPVASIAARWQLCPDPRSANPLDQSGWTWTENAIRHLMHYMLVREEVDYASKIAPTLDYWKAAADVCDEAIPLKAGGTEPRWRTCVSHKHTDTHASVKAAIMKCCDGWLGNSPEGAYIVYAGDYRAPTVDIGPDEITAFEWAGVGRDDDEAVNELVCGYVSAEHDYNSVETDAWRDEADIAERGNILSDSLDPAVPSHGQVRRLAKRQMARVNAVHRGTVTTNAGGRAVRGQRYINLRLIEAGTTFYDGPAEVTEVTRNMMSGGVTFSWVAADPNIDAWNPETEEGEPAPVGNRVALQPLETPTIINAYADFSDIGESGGLDGGSVQGVRIRIVADGPIRDDLTWYARWRVGSGAWSERQYSDADPGPGVSLVTDYVPYGTTVAVEVSYKAGDGRTSPWSTSTNVNTSP